MKETLATMLVITSLAFIISFFFMVPSEFHRGYEAGVASVPVQEKNICSVPLRIENNMFIKIQSSTDQIHWKDYKIPTN